MTEPYKTPLIAETGSDRNAEGSTGEEDSPLDTAGVKRDLSAPPRGYVNCWSGDRSGFGPCRSTMFPPHRRTGDPTFIKSSLNPLQGAD